MFVVIMFFSLAEFVINLAEKQPTFDGFKRILVKNGADFSVRVFPYLQHSRLRSLLYCTLNEIYFYFTSATGLPHR